MAHIFLSASYQERQEFLPLYEKLSHSKFVVHAPIFDYPASHPIDYRKLMDHTFREIHKCQLVIADATYKPIGVGLEVGYAKAMKIPVIYIQKKGSELSTTLLGTAQDHLIYEDGDFSEIISLCESKF